MYARARQQDPLIQAVVGTVLRTWDLDTSSHTRYVYTTGGLVTGCMFIRQILLQAFTRKQQDFIADKLDVDGSGRLAPGAALGL